MRLALTVLVFSACATAPRPAPSPAPLKAVVIVSANMEWKAVTARYPDARMVKTPWGDTFEREVSVAGQPTRVVFLHGGWGKVAAAGSAQYAIDRWHPRYLINLGTAGGFAGSIERHAIVLADRTLIYDIKEAMGDSAEAIADYATTIDLAWLTETPATVRKTLLVSGDRDLVPGELAELTTRYGAIAGDWESGAIAYTAKRNGTRVLILRGISDLVHPAGGEAYGNLPLFVEGAAIVMRRLLDELPQWLARCP
ncbi:MAG: 5'-methylthioadenosine/S-adenosylhomocysteine nucleosidase [Kofleriaceae bacterium]